MKALRAVAALSLTGSLLVVPIRAQAAELGGFTLMAEAAPIALHIYEAAIPIPAEPQLELSLSYSRAKLSTGPTGRAVSSLMWPGDVVGYGLPELLKNPDATYPVKVDAAHPSGPKDGKQEYVPGTGMTSHADDKSIEASAYAAKPALPVLPVPGLPIPPMLAAVEAWASNARATATGDKATATAYATAGSISLLGGLVKIHGLRVDSEAVSDGVKGTTTGTVSWKSLTVAGQTFAADQDGIKSPAGATALPKLPPDVAKRMADFGLAIDVPKVDKTANGNEAKVSGRGLTITLDTAVMRNKLSLGSLLDPFLALLPSELRTQLTPWLALAPKFTFILGHATSQATATPAFQGEAPPTDSGSVGGSGSGSGSGSVGGDVPPGTGDPAPVPVANGRQWPIFPGVPWYLFVLGLGLAAAASWGLRHFAGMMFAAAGCELGAANGIPNLRER
ncbi:MAG TPA: hypothetical protein DGT23_19775 [Micromonosporaceae bacterium]|nr:hypothetical protein [Micromonosporaceae bacterium]